MSTAIVRVFCRDGFVVAADGRKSGEYPSESAQKVFCFGNQSHLAYTFTGCVELGPTGTPDVLFTFFEHTRQFCETVSLGRFGTLLDYCQNLAFVINRSLRDVLDSGRVAYPKGRNRYGESGSDIADILVDGYFGKRPARAKIRFFHEDCVVQEPSVFLQELNPDHSIVSGIPEVWRLLVSGDQRFDKYHQELLSLHPNDCLNGHANSAKYYIDACSGPEAMDLDPDVAATIGGRLHMATITSADGFQWIPGFEH